MRLLDSKWWFETFVQLSTASFIQISASLGSKCARNIFVSVNGTPHCFPNKWGSHTSLQAFNTIFPYIPLLPLSSDTVMMSSLQSPSHVKHLRWKETYWAFPPQKALISYFHPLYFICEDRVPMLCGWTSSLTTTSAENAVSLHDQSPNPKMTSCLGRGSGTWTWKRLLLDLLRIRTHWIWMPDR